MCWLLLGRWDGQVWREVPLDLDDHRRAHTAADAECGDSTSAATGSKRVDQRGQNAGPARADRMAERNRTAAHVDLRQIEAELAGNGQRLRGKRLVQLEQDRCLRLTAVPGSSAFLVASTGPMPMMAGSIPVVAKPSTRAIGFLPSRRRALGTGDDERRRTIVDARRVACRHAAVVLERRLQCAQLLCRSFPRADIRLCPPESGRPSVAGPAPATISSLNAPLSIGLLRATLTLGGEPILIGAGDPVSLDDRLRR